MVSSWAAASVTAAARVDLGVLARLDVRGLDGGIAARVDGDVAAGRERGLHMGGGRVVGVLDGAQLLGLDVDIAARIERQIAIGGGKLAAHIVDVLAGVEGDAIRGADAGLLGRHIGVGAAGGDRERDAKCAQKRAVLSCSAGPARLGGPRWRGRAGIGVEQGRVFCWEERLPSRFTSVTFSMVWALTVTSWPCTVPDRFSKLPPALIVTPPPAAMVPSMFTTEPEAVRVTLPWAPILPPLAAMSLPLIGPSRPH